MLDNLAAHKVNRVEELIQAQGAELLYLSPYSPDLNPIEKGWSKIKQFLRSNRPRNPEASDQAVSEAIALITANDAQAWFMLVLAPLR